jgi:hypothetical protein
MNRRTTMKLKKTIAAVLALSAMSGAMVANAAENANASVTVLRPLTVNSDRNLVFGTLVRPAVDKTVSVSAAGDRLLDGVTAAAGTATSARFTVTGEGGQAVTVTVPASVTMTNNAASLVVTTVSSGDGSANLSNALGASGAREVLVGGSFPLTSTTAAGTYIGTFTVTATYN